MLLFNFVPIIIVIKERLFWKLHIQLGFFGKYIVLNDKDGFNLTAVSFRRFEEYLKFLYSEQGQELAAKHYYRPRLESVAKKHSDRFPRMNLFTIDEVFGGWQKAQQKHFADKGIFDQIYQ